MPIISDQQKSKSGTTVEGGVAVKGKNIAYTLNLKFYGPLVASYITDVINLAYTKTSDLLCNASQKIENFVKTMPHSDQMKQKVFPKFNSITISIKLVCIVTHVAYLLLSKENTDPSCQIQSQGWNSEVKQSECPPSAPQSGMGHRSIPQIRFQDPKAHIQGANLST